jgi:hypothetical protein
MKRSGLIIAAMGIVVVGTLSWYILGGNKRVATDPIDGLAIEDNAAADSAGLGFGVKAPGTSTESRGAGPSEATMVSYAPPPSFAGRNIHNVLLGTILNYAVEVVQYDGDRAKRTKLAANSRGQAPFIIITPAEGTWGMTRETMGEGHIVARIESDGDYMDLGIVSGFNFLWVGNDPQGNLEWVLIPGTAFAPYTNLKEGVARRILDQYQQVSSLRASIRDF